jgi:hypothetical protein
MAISDHLRSLMGSAATTDVRATATVQEPETPEDDAPEPEVEPEEDANEGDGEKAEANPPAPEAPKAADPAEVAEYCAANGCPALAGPLIREKATMDQVKAKVGAAETIRALVKDAGLLAPAIKADAADAYIAAGTSVEDVRAALWDRVVKAASPEIRSSIAADTGAPKASDGWDKAVGKVNARIEATQPKEG